MPSTLEPQQISRESYRFIAEKVYEHSRIRLGDDKQALVSGRLAKRLRALNLGSY
jgi:chemotaxis methyl-accepting protein methylase